MIKIDSANASDLLAQRIREDFPWIEIEFVFGHRMRAYSPKGRYDIRLMADVPEIRTSFLNKGENPLKHGELLQRSSGQPSLETLDEHIAAIRENENQLPWVRKSVDAENGVEIVSILPFGAAENAACVRVRTSLLTGFMSLDVENARELSPAEARLVAKALSRAAKLAARHFVPPHEVAQAA